MRALILATLLISAVSVPAFAAPSAVKEAQSYEAQLRADDGKMRLRHNLEKLVELWGRAKKEDRRAALEGEARAWKLLAHWSGRDDDKKRANDAAAKADGKAEPKRDAEAKREKKNVAPAPPVKESATRAMLAKVELEGDRLRLEVSGGFSSKRDLIPARGNQGARVFFDLTPVIAAREVMGSVAVERAGIAKVRVGQFDDDTARVVIDLEAGTPAESIAIDGAMIALGEAPANEEPVIAAAEVEPEEAPAVEPEETPELVAVEAKNAAEPTERDLRAIVEEMKNALPLAELEVTKKEEAQEPAAVAKVEPPLDEATMRALKRSTRDAVKPRDESVASIKKVVIDAGHGGKDHGARGVNGALEKDINLAIAMKLGAELKKRLGVKVVFTRTTDQFLSLERRSQLANNADADLFISVHANAHRKRSIYGIETYYLNTTSDRYSVRLARRENGVADEEAGEDTGPEPGVAEVEAEDASLPPGALGRDLKLLLADLAMRSASAESKRLAGHVQSSMVGTLRRKHEDIKDLGVKHALFYVLLGARMPSILIETGFVTHATEGKRLADADYQNGLASSIAQGIVRWVNERDALVRKSDLRDQTLASMR